MDNFQNFIQQNRLFDIASKHYFDVTLADLERVINNDFTQLKAELLSYISLF